VVDACGVFVPPAFIWERKLVVGVWHACTSKAEEQEDVAWVCERGVKA
jgi:hypothetical protein